MNFALIFKYAKYLPLLLNLIEFIREAERAFRGADSGPKKLAVVSEKLSALVTTLENSGVIPSKLASAIRNGATAIITLIVQFMNAEHGGVDPNPVPTTRPTNYLKKFDPPVPDDPQLMGEAYGFVLGDQVCAESVDSEWMVAKKGGSRLGAPLLRVIGG